MPCPVETHGLADALNRRGSRPQDPGGTARITRSASRTARAVRDEGIVQSSPEGLGVTVPPPPPMARTLRISSGESALGRFPGINMPPRRSFPVLRPEIAAYIAGLVGGEGTVTLSRLHAGENRRLVVSIANTELQILEFVRDQVQAGKITRKSVISPRHTPSYNFAITSSQASAERQVFARPAGQTP